MKKNVRILLLLFLMSSCSYLRERTPEKFQNVDADQITRDSEYGNIKEGLNKKIIVTDIDKCQELFLPSIIDTVYGIKLDNHPEALLGSIEKMKLTDDAIYLLDKYTTKSVKVFSRSGKYTNTIGQRGRGPGEYYEPTDFYVGDNEIIIYDQFTSKLNYYDMTGNFIKDKKIPFYALSFHRYNKNSYVFHTFDSDNYHLPKILNYSLIWTDSTFAIKHINAFREKDKYTNLISENDMNFLNQKLYYHEPYNDTVFMVSPDGNLYDDFKFSFPKNKLPPELLLRKNFKQKIRDTSPNSTKNYVENYSFPIITQDFLYTKITVNSRIFNVFYSLKTNNVIIDNQFNQNDSPIMFFPPFNNILNCEGNTLIGYTDASNLHERFELVQKYDEMHLLSDELIEFFKDIKEIDNPIIVFTKLKVF